MKVIFLDIDGVLATPDSIHKGGHEHLDSQCVEVLNTILDSTDARIVISSTWRMFRPIGELKGVLSDQGLNTKRIISITPVLHAPRGIEIHRWLCNHEEIAEFSIASPVTDFCIIDDDSDMEHLIHKLVQTDTFEGLQEHHIQKVLSMLNEN